MSIYSQIFPTGKVKRNVRNEDSDSALDRELLWSSPSSTGYESRILAVSSRLDLSHLFFQSSLTAAASESRERDLAIEVTFVNSEL